MCAPEYFIPVTLNRIQSPPSGSFQRYGNQLPALLTLAMLCSCLSSYATSSYATSSYATSSYAFDGAGPDWTPPVEQQRSLALDSERDGRTVSLQQSVRKFSTTDDPTRTALVSHAYTSMATGVGTIHFASSASQGEQVAGGGLTWGPLTTYSVVGSGEKYSRTSSQYAGLDPYKYHGGSDTPYRFHGAGFNFDTSRSTSLQLGFTSVSAHRLENRRASFVEFSSRRFFGRYTHIERGGDSIGHGFDAGIWLGKFNLGYQELSTRQDVSTRRLRLQWNPGRSSRIWLDYSRHRNALYSDHEDDMIMVTFQRSLGRGAILPLYAAEDETAYGDEPGEAPEGSEGEEVPESGGFRRGYLLAGGAAAALLVASSGSGSQDEAPRVNAQHEAARAALNVINPLSVQQNLEYGAYIYRNTDGTFASSDARQGTATSVALPPIMFEVPVGTTGTAAWHTHAGPDPRFDNENFSTTDLEADRQQQIDGYLGTPAGQFKYHELSTDRVTVIGTVNN